jgi:hypothetical protein
MTAASAARAAPEKVCRGCHRPKPLVEFYAHPTNGDRRQTRCVECMRAASAEQWKRTKAARSASISVAAT